MTERLTEAPETAADPAQTPAAPAGMPPGSLYQDSVEEYLEAAEWLTAADAPAKVNARAIARSLDSQLARTGEVQSALASMFDKALLRLDRRRPPPTPPPPGLGDDDGDGTPSMFETLE